MNDWISRERNREQLRASRRQAIVTISVSKDNTRILDTFLQQYIFWGRLIIFYLISLAQQKQFEHPRCLSILSPD
jgi:hypothetical protein